MRIDPYYLDDDSLEPNCRRPKNDIFVNYSFEDIGKSFISHLLGALRRRSLTIFDHTMLPIGYDGCSGLLNALEDSGKYVLVFSINYAFSIRCLDELVNNMDSFSKFDQRKLLPVFYKVEPSDVRNQQSPFKKAFKSHKVKFDRKSVWKWRKALKDAGQLSGYSLQDA